ncbi:hypothetical protein D3C72_1644240 [compost metagenome]
MYIRQWQAQVGTQLHQVRQHHAQRQRNQRGNDEPAHGFQADAAGRLAVAHVGDTDRQGREHQQRNDHLDQAQEDVGDDGNIASDLSAELGIRESGVASIADNNAEDHGNQDVQG